MTKTGVEWGGRGVEWGGRGNSSVAASLRGNQPRAAISSVALSLR